MRNLFDQYSQPENRLTHALGVCLDEDRALLKRFVKWLGLDLPVTASALTVEEQHLPGEDEELREDEADWRGLPDLLIHDDERWCLIVESKVKAVLTGDQLRRHARTLRRRGFDRTHILCLTKREDRSPRGAIGRTWSALYEWLGATSRQDTWSRRLRDYLRVAETRLVHDEYLDEGTLTMFDGFRFGPRTPYTYAEAKRLLKLALEGLRQDSRLRRLGMDPRGTGRSAITGTGRSSVWDFLPLIEARGHPFTAFPHLTLSINREVVEVAVTVPNGVRHAMRRRLAELGVEGLTLLHRRILKRTSRALKRGASVRAYAVQRHFPHQRSEGITDGRVAFDLRAVVPGAGGGVRFQPQWTEFLADLLAKKKANIQFGYVVDLPHGMPGLGSPLALDLISSGWQSLEPLLRVMREGKRVLR